MRPLALLLLTISPLISCSDRALVTASTYENFRGFTPIDPIEYLKEIPVVVNDQVVNKYPIAMNKEEILGFMANETVIVSVAEFTAEGKLGYMSAGYSVKGHSYKVTMDYMKFATLVEYENEDVNKPLGYKRVGVGLRVIANVIALESGINLGDLFSIGLAAKASKLSGTLMLEVIGIKSREVTSTLPLPSEINQTTIQSAMQAMATIKSKIYDAETTLYPQVMAVKSNRDNSNTDIQMEIERKANFMPQVQENEKKQ